ncbi:MAG: rhamnose transport system ATP-binding protein [Thermosediminibacterales bacterium]|nr:rhamnose transport system ATP-binding protein [Thermosediminibacterales bacterium]
MDNYILQLKGIIKDFPGVRALNNVNFDLKPGEVHAILGENGAGKSTFIKIITGVHQPDSGEIFLNGQKVTFPNPTVAREKGIAAIYQNITCFPDMTVTENIFLGHEYVDRGTKRILWKQMNEKARELLRSIGSEIDPEEKMGSLSIAQQQMVEISKALSQEAKILIMDEPTAALTQRETQELFRLTRNLKESGTSIIFISHRLDDIFEIADRVTVFRDGCYIGTWNLSELTRDDLIKLMVGREITQLFPKKKAKIGREILKVEGLCKMGIFADISFCLHEGEILGLTGLIGSGRSEVAQAIFGIDPADEGIIYVNNQPVKIDNPLKAMKLGIGYLPEDRQKQGLVLPFSIMENITLPVIDDVSKSGWLHPSNEYITAKKLAELLQVKAASVFNKVYSLSGGNQQKVVVAKLLAAKLKILILDEPTKGIDVGAKAAIHEIMSDLACQGFGIIMISSEMPEVLGMSDRILVMHEGRITAEFDRCEATQEKIMKAAITKGRFKEESEQAS